MKGKLEKIKEFLKSKIYNKKYDIKGGKQ